MCVIASQPVGKKIKAGTINQMWKRNPDGGGIAWIEDGQIKVYKTMKLKDFKRKYKEVTEKHGKHDILVHMRIATHGSVCIDNNHPFSVDPQTMFAHNGILPNVFHPSPKSDLSDTRYFNQVFLQNVKPVAFDDPAFCEVIGEMIGTFNKMVFLSANKKLRKETYIINEGYGQWVSGIWYSNTNHVPASRVTTFTQPKLPTSSMQSDYDAWGDEALGWYQDEGESCDIVEQDGVIIRDVDGDIWNDDGNEDWTTSTIVPEEAWVEPEFCELIENMMDNCGFIYDHIDDMLGDYALRYDGKQNDVSKSLVCDSCNKFVDGEMKRNCTKECPCLELSQISG